MRQHDLHSQLKLNFILWWTGTNGCRQHHQRSAPPYVSIRPTDQGNFSWNIHIQYLTLSRYTYVICIFTYLYSYIYIHDIYDMYCVLYNPKIVAVEVNRISDHAIKAWNKVIPQRKWEKVLLYRYRYYFCKKEEGNRWAKEVRLKFT